MNHEITMNTRHRFNFYKTSSASFDKSMKAVTTTLREKCPYSEFFWSIFSHIWTNYGDLLCISLYSIRMGENADQKNSEYGPFLRSAIFLIVKLAYKASTSCLIC